MRRAHVLSKDDVFPVESEAGEERENNMTGRQPAECACLTGMAQHCRETTQALGLAASFRPPGAAAFLPGTRAAAREVMKQEGQLRLAAWTAEHQWMPSRGAKEVARV